LAAAFSDSYVTRLHQAKEPNSPTLGISHAFSEGFFVHKLALAENNARYEEIYRDNKAPATHS